MRYVAVPVLAELSQELRKVMIEAADTEEQVRFWRNYPLNQKLEKREKIKCLKSEIRKIDKLHDGFEGENEYDYLDKHAPVCTHTMWMNDIWTFLYQMSDK